MTKTNNIREGFSGGARFPAKNIIPDEAEKLPFSTKSYEFYLYKKGQKAVIYIKTISYHPGILEVPLSKLEEMIEYLKQE
jgi:hypothetical protein